MHQGSLHDIHKREALTTTDYHGWELPAVYTSLEGEFDAAITSACLVDLSCYGRMEVGGGDRIDLLHRLSSNDLLNVAIGDARNTLFVTDKGRLVDSVLISFRKGDLLAIHSPGSEDLLRDWIGKYTITEDIGLNSLTSSTSMISIVGSKAFSAYFSIFSRSILSNKCVSSSDLPYTHEAVAVARNGLEFVHMIVPNPQAVAFWTHLAEGGTSKGLQRIGVHSFEALRISHGIPTFGREISELFNPFEVGLEDAISFTKGCYIGQEVIARLDTYKKVQKKLVGLEFSEIPVSFSEPAEVMLDGKSVGFVTSVFRERLHGRFIGLGVLRLELATPGRTLKLTINGNEFSTKISKLTTNT